MPLTRTYALATSPEPAMPWPQYERIVQEAWSGLLRSDSDSDEGKYQAFLEQHPSLLPWPYGAFGFGHHGVFPSAVISQPVLPSFTRRVPDFLWITRDSACVYAVLIEIEAPGKPWATKAGKQSEQFTQAVDQLKEWKSYFAQDLNAAQFLKHYKVPSEFVDTRTFVQHYVLIYGRRSDPTLTPEFKSKRHHLQGEREHFMTYDRLAPSASLSNVLSTKIDANGYRAIWVPPTVQLSPFSAADFAIIRDKEPATAVSPYFSDARRTFVQGRWTYWDNWVRAADRGMANSLDIE